MRVADGNPVVEEYFTRSALKQMGVRRPEGGEYRTVRDVVSGERVSGLMWDGVECVRELRRCGLLPKKRARRWPVVKWDPLVLEAEPESVVTAL